MLKIIKNILCEKEHNKLNSGSEDSSNGLGSGFGAVGNSSEVGVSSGSKNGSKNGVSSEAGSGSVAGRNSSENDSGSGAGVGSGDCLEVKMGQEVGLGLAQRLAQEVGLAQRLAQGRVG